MKCENAVRYIQMHLNNHPNISAGWQSSCSVSASNLTSFIRVRSPLFPPVFPARRCTAWTRRTRTPRRWRSSVWTATQSLRSKRSCSTPCTRAAPIHRGPKLLIWTWVRHTLKSAYSTCLTHINDILTEAKRAAVFNICRWCGENWERQDKGCDSVEERMEICL